MKGQDMKGQDMKGQDMKGQDNHPKTSRQDTQATTARPLPSCTPVGPAADRTGEARGAVAGAGPNNALEPTAPMGAFTHAGVLCGAAAHRRR